MSPKYRPLSESDLAVEVVPQWQDQATKKSRNRFWIHLILSNSITFLVTLLISRSPWTNDLISRWQAVTAWPQQSLPSPAIPAISYKIDTPPFDYWSDDIYFGPPTDASETAWNELIPVHNIQLSPAEAEQFNSTRSVRHKNGNYLVEFGIYHNLHCLRRIRQSLAAEHYYPNQTPEQREHDLEHTGHCLSALRTSVMCHPDLTPNRLYWSGRGWHDLSVAPDVTRECVDWEKFEGFVKPRRYDPSDIAEE